MPPNKAAVTNHPPTMNWEAGRKLQAGSDPDGWGSGWHGLLFLMSCAYTKAEHLELPCGPSIWPASHLPEPDAPKQLRAKQHESFIGERDIHPHTHIPAHTYTLFLSAHMGGPTATFIRLLKSYEYAVGIKAGTDLSNCPYFIKME